MKRDIEIPPKKEDSQKGKRKKRRYIILMGIVILLLFGVYFHNYIHKPNAPKAEKAAKIIYNKDGSIEILEEPLTGEYNLCPICNEILP